MNTFSTPKRIFGLLSIVALCTFAVPTNQPLPRKNISTKTVECPISVTWTEDGCTGYGVVTSNCNDGSQSCSFRVENACMMRLIMPSSIEFGGKGQCGFVDEEIKQKIADYINGNR